MAQHGNPTFVSWILFTTKVGAFRTSPVNSLYAEANEPSLNLRWKKLSLQYYLKLKSNRDNPTHKAVFEPLYKDEFIQKDRIIPPFSLRCEADMNCIDTDLEDVAYHQTTRFLKFLYGLVKVQLITIISLQIRKLQPIP